MPNSNQANSNTLGSAATITITSSSDISFVGPLSLITPHSPFFAMALKPPFAESATNTVSFPTFTASVIAAFIEYCNSGAYTYLCGSIREFFSSEARFDMGVIRFAHYIMADKLVKHSRAKLMSRMNPDFWAGEFPDIIAEVFRHDNYEEEGLLRDFIAEMVLIGLENGMELEVLWEAGLESGEFGMMVARKMWKRSEELKKRVTAALNDISQTLSE